MPNSSKDKKGWRLLLLSHDLACAKLSLRLMEAFPMLREAALASGELFLEAIKTRNMVAANRLLDAGLRIDDDILSRLGATDEKEILAPWSSIVLDMLPTCTVMVDRVISLHPALGSDAVVVACENARWDVALRLLGDKTLKLDEQHLSSLLTKTVDLAARMPFDDLLKWQGVQVYESHHPWKGRYVLSSGGYVSNGDNDKLNKHIELKGASSLYVAFDKRSDLSALRLSFTLDKTDTSDDSRWFEYERHQSEIISPGSMERPFSRSP